MDAQEYLRNRQGATKESTPNRSPQAVLFEYSKLNMFTLGVRQNMEMMIYLNISVCNTLSVR